jgi:hypothetical protein
MLFHQQWLEMELLIKQQEIYGFMMDLFGIM